MKEKRNGWVTLAAAVLAVMLLIPMIFPKTAAAAQDYSTIRVRLNLSDSSQSVTVKGSYTVKEDSSIVLKSGNKYTLAVSSGKIRLTGDGVDELLSSVTFVRGDAKELSDGLLKIGSYSYLGDMKFTAVSGSVRVINTVDLEHYLYGVVAAEMGESFPSEALKAQAICARCYAIRKIDASDSSDTYDIVGAASDQAYKGYNASNVKVIDAVDATRGQVLYCNGKIIETFFSASNGGQTESAGNAWGGGASKDAQYSYLTIKDDPYDLAACKGNTSYEQRYFVPADPTSKRTAEGRYSYTVLNDLQERAYERLKAEYDLKAISDVTLLEVKSLENGTKRYASSKASKSYVDAEATLTVRLPEAVEREVAVTLVLMNKSGSGYSLSHDYLNGKFRLRGIEQAEGGWYVCNRRYGHGVGLSQMGAKNMAQKDKSYREILAFYYTNTTIKTLQTGGMQTPNYTIGKSYVTGVQLGTSVKTFLNGMSGYTLYSSDGTKKTSGTVATGDFVKDASGAQRSIVIYGDLNGDGEIALTDLLREQKYILELLQLNGAYREAADVTRDGSVNIADLLRIQKHLLGATEIAQ